MSELEGSTGLNPMNSQEYFQELPERFRTVAYDGRRIPGVENQDDLGLGANCQVYAYGILKHFGFVLPHLRSSELWLDAIYSEKVTQFQQLDLMLYHSAPEAYGAHVAVYWRDGVVLHLSKENGLPQFESHRDMCEQSRYRHFIGAKRPIVRE